MIATPVVGEQEAAVMRLFVWLAGMDAMRVFVAGLHLYWATMRAGVAWLAVGCAVVVGNAAAVPVSAALVQEKVGALEKFGAARQVWVGSIQVQSGWMQQEGASVVVF